MGLSVRTSLLANPTNKNMDDLVMERKTNVFHVITVQSKSPGDVCA